MSGKWLDLLKEIAPDIKRGQFGAIQTAAPSFGVELAPINVRDVSEMERAKKIYRQHKSSVLNQPLFFTI